jgi:hypothetical protein
MNNNQKSDFKFMKAKEIEKNNSKPEDIFEAIEKSINDMRIVKEIFSEK